MAGRIAVMPQANDQAAALLDEYADLMEMTGGDPFRARVYTKAARAIAAYPHDVAGLPTTALLRIPGVGKSIAAKVTEILSTGTFTELADLRADIPDGVRQLTRIPALGPRRALQLYRELAISSPEQLREAIADGQAERPAWLRAEECGQAAARHRPAGDCWDPGSAQCGGRDRCGGDRRRRPRSWL